MTVNPSQNNKIDKVEHAIADYWHSEAVDVVLFREASKLLFMPSLPLIICDHVTKNVL